MNKLVYKQAFERSNGLCEICGSNNGVELHHILYGNGNRKKCERVETVIFLCYEHHRGTKGIHGRDGHKLDLKLKQKLQQYYFDEGIREIEVRKLMSDRLY